MACMACSIAGFPANAAAIAAGFAIAACSAGAIAACIAACCCSTACAWASLCVASAGFDGAAGVACAGAAGAAAADAGGAFASFPGASPGVTAGGPRPPASPSAPVPVICRHAARPMDERSSASLCQRLPGKGESVVYDTSPAVSSRFRSLDALSTRVGLASVRRRARTPRGMGSRSFPQRETRVARRPARR